MSVRSSSSLSLAPSSISSRTTASSRRIQDVRNTSSARSLSSCGTRSTGNDSIYRHSETFSNTNNDQNFFSHKSLLNAVARKMNSTSSIRGGGDIFTERKLEKIWILFCESLREDFVRNLRRVLSTNKNNTSSTFDENDELLKIDLAVQVPEIGEFQITLEKNLLHSRRSKVMMSSSSSPSSATTAAASGTFIPFRSMIQASTIPNLLSSSSSSTSILENGSFKLSEKLKQQGQHGQSEENEAARAVVESTLSDKYSPIFSKNSANRFLRDPSDPSSSLAKQNVRSRSTSPVVRKNDRERNTSSCSSTFDMTKFIQVVETIFMFSASSSYENDKNNNNNRADVSVPSYLDISGASLRSTRTTSTTTNELLLRNSGGAPIDPPSKKRIATAVKLCFLMAAQRCCDGNRDFTLDVMPLGSLSLLHGCRRCWFRVSREFAGDLGEIWVSLEERNHKSIEREQRSSSPSLSLSRNRARSAKEPEGKIESSNNNKNNTNQHLLLFADDKSREIPKLEVSKKIKEKKFSQPKILSPSSAASASPLPSPPPLLSRVLDCQHVKQNQQQQQRTSVSSSSRSSLAVKSSSRPSILSSK